MLKAFMLGSVGIAMASAPATIVGEWRGIALFGPSKIAQTMDTDGLLKLQVSKAFIKTLRYSIDLKADGTFVSIVTGADIEPRKSNGNWKQSGTLLTLSTLNENGAKVSRTITASVSADEKRILVIVPSKPGLPITKLIFTPLPQPATPATQGPAVKPPTKKPARV